jgi:hypothetical protein
MLSAGRLAGFSFAGFRRCERMTNAASSAKNASATIVNTDSSTEAMAKKTLDENRVSHAIEIKATDGGQRNNDHDRNQGISADGVIKHRKSCMSR